MIIEIGIAFIAGLAIGAGGIALCVLAIISKD
jgi:hypothetical protein